MPVSISYCTYDLGAVQEALHRLESNEVQERYKALRNVKNAIIGNVTKKAVYVQLGAIPRLSNIVQHDTEPGCLVQAAATLGSIAYDNDEAVQEITRLGGVDGLVRLLHNPDAAVAEASVRALKTIYGSWCAPIQALCSEKVLGRLVAMLSSVHGSSAECSACLLAQCCRHPNHQTLLARMGALQALLPLVASPLPKAQEAALEAVASLTEHGHVPSDVYLTSLPGLQEQLIQLIRGAHPPVRLLAATCMVNMHRAGLVCDRSSMHMIVLPALVKLCANTNVRAKAPAVLAHLVSDSCELQQLAIDAHALGVLKANLTDPNLADPDPDRNAVLEEGTLLALAALCSHREEGRLQLVEGKLLAPAIARLDHARPLVRVAACRCMAALSRSVHLLRTVLPDAGLADRILPLLRDRDSGVRVEAGAVMCNLLMEFSPMRKGLVDRGVLSHLSDMLDADPPEVTNALWAMANFLFRADNQSLTLLLPILPWSRLQKLLTSPHEEIRHRAMALLQNATCNVDTSVHPAVAHLLRESETELPGVMCQLLDPHLSPSVIRLRTLHVLGNLLAGDAECRLVLMADSQLLKGVMSCLNCTEPAIHVATLRALINLAKGPSEGGLVWLNQHGGQSPTNRLIDLSTGSDLDAAALSRTLLVHMGVDLSTM
eukprot:comp9629_c0_seq1/m.4639 comp9629_c0_seq1/g.4639  ORF comp9629_c0_seq1/g.4639 comp9629_c0_seq1/m.4639 type:complete len:659 (-) comp9629_c0_seq1:155-2131(-)